MQDLIGKIVDVISAETKYTGRLIEVNETDVYIETEAGWLMIPVENIIDIVEKNIEQTEES
ncbi:MAG: hypothetical protein LLF28_01490 [Nitrospiraceae bacterium]|nr:hypothetical protein [Nitrospiraceae bacterium]